MYKACCHRRVCGLLLLGGVLRWSLHFSAAAVRKMALLLITRLMRLLSRDANATCISAACAVVRVAGWVSVCHVRVLCRNG